MDTNLLRSAVLDSRDGIAISEHGAESNPIVFVNPAFERMTGYALEEIVGTDCRFLQNDDREQPAIAVIRQAVSAGEYCLVTLRNYRKDGSMFWNELSLSPVHDALGVVTNYIGIQKDVSARVLAEIDLLGRSKSLEQAARQMAALAIRDGLTGIYNRRFFDAQLDIQWRICHRSRTPLSLILVDIDQFKRFNDGNGHVAGDAALRAVAESLNGAFNRASDFVARYGGEEFAALCSGMGPAQASRFAAELCERVAKLRIPHAGTPKGYLTISAGHATERFEARGTLAALVERADQGLYLAKRAGGDTSRCVEDTGSVFTPNDR